MFKSLLRFSILAVWMCTTPALTFGQSSKTVSFNLSVTIPEHARIPSTASPVEPVNADQKLTRPHIQTELRDNTRVYLASYVVD